MRWRKTATERRPVWPYIVEENGRTKQSHPSHYKINVSVYEELF